LSSPGFQRRSIQQFTFENEQANHLLPWLPVNAERSLRQSLWLCTLSGKAGSAIKVALYAMLQATL